MIKTSKPKKWTMMKQKKWKINSYEWSKKMHANGENP